MCTQKMNMCGRIIPGRSCVYPLSRKGKLVGVLYLENNLAPARLYVGAGVTVLQLLASQAAISTGERRSLFRPCNSRLGCCSAFLYPLGLSSQDGTPDFVNRVWLDYSGQTLDFVRSHPEAWMTALHPEDPRDQHRSAFWEGVRSGTGLCMVEARFASRKGQDLSVAPHSSRGLAGYGREGPQIRRYNLPTSTTRSAPRKRCAKASMKLA